MPDKDDKDKTPRPAGADEQADAGQADAAGPQPSEPPPTTQPGGGVIQEGKPKG